MSTTTSKRFFGPAALTTSAATKYTCPSSTVAVIRRMRVSNPDSSQHSFTISIGADATGTRLYAAVPVAAGGAVDIWGPFTLEAAEIVQAFADNTAVVLEIDGTETA